MGGKGRGERRLLCAATRFCRRSSGALCWLAMRIVLFTLMSLACSAVLAATVYKWVDDDGVVHYSDQPHANAEKVQGQAPQTYKATPVDQGGVPPPPNESQSATAYTGCTIVHPADQQEFSNIESLVIAVRVDPQLHGGDQIYILVDGGG